MTAETGQVTGTKDRDYDLIWFRRAQNASRKGAEEGKSLLTARLNA